MTKVSIILDLDEDIFEEVIAPRKAERKLSSFMVNLLTAYYKNESVRGVVDGVSDNQDLQGILAFQEQLNLANKSLEAIGLFAESGNEYLEDAKTSFDISETSIVPNKSERTSGIADKSVLEDIQLLKDEFARSREENKRDIESIKDMLSSLVTGGIQAKTSPVVEAPEASFEEDNLDLGLDLGELEIKLDTTEEAKEEEVDGSDVLNQLLAGNSISFGGM